MGHLGPILRRASRAAASAALAALILAIPLPASSDDPFAGFSAAVREQAARVVAVAGTGRPEVVAREAGELRRVMRAQGILSIDALPDLVFARARREGPRSRAAACVREVMAASPLCVQAWAWLVEEDIRTLRLVDLGPDLRSLAAAASLSAPGMAGAFAFGTSWLSAAACWFAAWASIALFLRARTALEADIARIARVPFGDLLAAAAAVVVFLLPLSLGLGTSVAACLWVAMSAGYLRRGELALMTAAILALVVPIAGGSVAAHLGDPATGAGRGGWLAVEGTIPAAWPARGEPGGPSPWAVRYARARSEMNRGRVDEAERLWTELAFEARDLPAVLNNRGISRARRGMTKEALSDFEAALSRRPGDGPTLWNAYQARLQLLDLEGAQAIQPRAWAALATHPLFRVPPGEMEGGEWIASPLPGEAIRTTLVPPEGSRIAKAGKSSLFRYPFGRLDPRAALAFLFLAMTTSWLWRALSARIWLHVTCRGCGINAIASVAGGDQETCAACRSQTGAGIREGEEKELRSLGIALHRRYVHACSVLVPGSGALWAGKPIQTALYGGLLSLALGALTALAPRGAGGPLAADLAAAGRVVAAVSVLGLWFLGAAWGIRTFRRFQERYSLSRVRG